jgi:hypothetical protein
MNSRREVCRCGHDRDTHFGEKHDGACTGLGCNVMTMNCRRFRDETDKTPSTLPPPGQGRNVRGHASWCRCYDCKRALGLR